MGPLPAADDLASAFARDGVVCVRGVLDADQVAAAVRAIDTVLAHPGPLTQVASGADDPGFFTEDFCRWQEVPEIEQLALRSHVPAIAAALMATPQVRFYHDHVLVKEGRTRQHTPWHQDQPYPQAGVRVAASGAMVADARSSRTNEAPQREIAARVGVCRTSSPPPASGSPSTARVLPALIPAATPGTRPTS
jgi:hypothetical protein